MTLRVALACLWLCQGCVILASKGDYADYREIRLARESNAYRMLGVGGCCLVASGQPQGTNPLM